MSKSTVLQVRMDAELKDDADKLFKSMGTTLGEVVRIMLRRSVDMGALPFSLKKVNKKSAAGYLQRYANPELMKREKEAWANAAAEKHNKISG